VPAIDQAVATGQVVVIDEIGPMELFSTAFRAAVLRAVDSGRPVLATIVRRPHPWADALKRRPGVRLIEITPANRDALVDMLIETFQ
jgi:nucleoside-triphosphatase